MSPQRSSRICPPAAAWIARPLARRCVLTCFCVLVGATGCGGASGNPGAPTASANRRDNVMLIDQGIDVSVPDLRGKVVASFTLACNVGASGDGAAAGSDDGSDDAGAPDPDAGADQTPSFDTIKRLLIDNLMVRDDRCQIVEGISAKTDPLAAQARFRDRWNAMIQQRLPGNQFFTYDEYTELTTALDEELTSFGYHGTATASTIGHENPGVRLVLVERKLGSRGATAQQFECLVQAEIDQTVALFTDAEVRDAYAHTPLSAADQALQEIADRYGVGLINESFGQPPRAAIEQLQTARACPPIDLRAYYAALGDLARARREAQAATGPLLVQSAGNDATQIDSAADYPDCSPGNDRHLLVGSYDLDQRRSAFSNFGSCVDLYAPGERIVTTYAGGWLVVARGTSFAAPLTARLLSLTAQAPFDPVAARDQLLDLRGGDAAIPMGSFPKDFFYQKVASAGGALLGPSSSDAVPPAGRTVAGPIDLSGLLAPLRQMRTAVRMVRRTGS